MSTRSTSAASVTLVLALLAAPLIQADGITKVTVRDHRRRTIYHSPQTPGYTCWAGIWTMPDASVMIAFTQATGPLDGWRQRAPQEILDRLPTAQQDIPAYDMTGKSWSGPQYVTPELDFACAEWDTAELENGDLLAVFRAITYDDSGKAVKQDRRQAILAQQGDTWAPGPISLASFPHDGHPELLRTREGVILHVAPTALSWVPGEVRTHPKPVGSADGKAPVAGGIETRQSGRGGRPQQVPGRVELDRLPGVDP
jgi:hypothetical protein